MSFKKKYAMLASTATVTMILAACAGGGETTEEETSDAGASNQNGESTAEIPEFPETVENEGEPIDGGTLEVGLVSDSAFPGIFNYEFYSINTDAQLMSYMMPPVLSQDENFMWSGEDAAGDIDLDEETNTVTITLQDGVLWHDGEQVTADDILFTHEIIGHPDYNGVRYSEDFQNIVGMEEFKAGEADEISGITVSDDELTIEIEYESVGPQMLQAGGGVWAYAAPRHHLGHLDVTEIEGSPEVRENPIGFGPFRVTKVVPGESVEYEAFEDYFLGEPNIDNVIVERVPTSGVVEALNAGEFDYVHNMPVDQYESFEDGIPGYTTLGHQGQSYDYIGFKMGEWDAEEGRVDYDPDSKMADLNLRQAMAHALDIDTVGENFFNGLRYRATSHIIPNFGDYFNEDVEGYPYDPEMANQLLDEAGYEDVDGDGYREDPEGNELVITYAARANSDVAEPIAYYYIQAWEEIGLNVELLEGRLHETNAFYDRVQEDDPAIDVYEGGWGTGSDPTPDGFYAPTAAFNYPRWESEENNEYLEQMVSEEAFDLDWRVDVFHEWQEYFMHEAAPAVPTFWRTEIQLVNDRVSEFYHEMLPGTPIYTFIHEMELLEEEPVNE